MSNLIIGVMYVNDELLLKIKDELVGLYGPIKSEMEPYDFTSFTKYYFDEMGPKIMKKMLVFDKKITKKDLVSIKKEITLLEKKYSVGDKRQINIDPGLIDKSRFALASFKTGTDYKEDLGDGVYAHTVLEFDSEVKTFWHTFPDYKKHKDLFLELVKDL